MDRGHTRLAFLNLARRPLVAPILRPRLRGSGGGRRGACADPRIRASSSTPTDTGATHNPETVETLIRQYLSPPPRPTGIFVADDMQVAMIQPTLQKHGIEIGPGQRRAISCNNEEPYLVGLTPKPAVMTSASSRSAPAESINCSAAGAPRHPRAASSPRSSHL